MNIDIAQIITQALGFFLLVFLMKKFAFGPVLSVLDERKEKISGEFQEIERTKQELETLQKNYEQKLKEIDQQAKLKIQDAIAKSDIIAKRMLDEARKDAAAIMTKAQENVSQEIQSAKNQIRDEVINLSLMAAGRIIGAELDSAKHAELISSTINEVQEF